MEQVRKLRVVLCEAAVDVGVDGRETAGWVDGYGGLGVWGEFCEGCHFCTWRGWNARNMIYYYQGSRRISSSLNKRP